MSHDTSLKWKLSQHLEYKWWQRYLRKKDVDQYLNWKTNSWNKVLETISSYLPEFQSKLILDAGCGPAGIFISLKESLVVALDPLIDKYYELPHFKPDRFQWTSFEKKQIEQLNDNNKYDIIFCMNAINHVNDVTLCYQKLIDALKPGGHLVISTDAHRHFLLKKIFQIIPGDVLHPVQLSINEYLNFLEKHQLRIVKNILYKPGNIFNYYITIATK